MIECPNCKQEIDGAEWEVKMEWIEAYRSIYIDGLGFQQTAARLGVHPNTITRYIQSMKKARPGLIETFEVNDVPDIENMIHLGNRSPDECYHKVTKKPDPVKHKF